MIMETRPLRADAQRNRDRILAAARERFAQDGPRAQMEDIAKGACVGVGTVYRHFPTKEALLSAMVAARFRGFAAIALEAEKCHDALEAFETAILGFLEATEGDAGFQLAMMGSADLEWDGVVEDKAVLNTIMERIFDRAKAAGALREDFTFADFPMLMCAITSTMYFKPGTTDWRRHYELVLHGVAGPRG